MALDGNTQDTKTHIDTWNFLRNLSGRSDFVYVADSKLCSKGNMKYIDENHGKFITVLPATRSETLWFHEYIQDHRVDWKDVFVRRRSKGDIRFRVFDSPIPSSEGFRIVWVWSSQKEDLDSDTRDRIIRRSVSDLESIESALKRRHMKKERIVEKAEGAIKGVPYIKYEIKEEHVETFRKSGRGRPSAGSTYRRIENPVYHISWSIDRNAVERDSRSDGIFPLITNCMDTEAADVLSRYKYQPMLEKRYEQIKSVYGVMPVLFKSIARIEEFLFVYFIAMIIQSLIERDVRIAMVNLGMKSIPLYSEERECSSPTCYRIFSAFDNMQVHRLISNGKETERFYTDISDVQKLILSLLGIPEEEFRPE